MNTKEIHYIRNKLIASHALANYLIDTPPEEREEEDITMLAETSAKSIDELLKLMVSDKPDNN